MMAKKNILLFKRMCQDAGLQDVDLLVDILTVGAKLTGDSGKCREFPQQSSEPSMTA